MGDDEARVRGPGIDGEAAFLAPSLYIGAVEDHEGQAEALVEQERRGNAASLAKATAGGSVDLF